MLHFSHTKGDMVDLSKLSLGDKIVLGTGIVLIIDLLFLPWHDIDLGPLGSVSITAIESPNAFWGVLALLLTIAIVGVVAATRLANVRLPDLPVSLGLAVMIATFAVLGLLVLKFILETDALGFGCWLGILLAAGMAYGGFVRSREPDPATGAY